MTGLQDAPTTACSANNTTIFKIFESYIKLSFGSLSQSRCVLLSMHFYLNFLKFLSSNDCL
jgi:hypothetical protein